MPEIRYTAEQLAPLAAKIFDPERLLPNSDGRQVLCRIDEDEVFWTTGFRDGAWDVLDGEGNAARWDPEGVFNFYDLKKIACLANGCGLPIRPGEDAAEVQAWLGRHGILRRNGEAWVFNEEILSR